MKETQDRQPMAYRTEIERALDEMISEETGKKFQGIAVVHTKQKWPQLVACERNWDGGLDAYASGELEPEGKGIGLACSITAMPSKVEDDAENAKKNHPDLRVLIFFSTPKEVTQYTANIWAKDVLEKSACSSSSSRAKSSSPSCSIPQTPTSAEISWESPSPLRQRSMR